MDSRSPHAGVIKRIRQACASCRRRKVKCSGDRPVCTHCREGRRSCVYEPYSATAATDTGKTVSKEPVATVNTELLQRISSIESALNRLNQGNLDLARFNQAALIPTSVGEPQVISSLSTIEEQPALDFTSLPPNPNVDSPTFDTLPPPAVIRSLVDLYFARIHNRPYSYFHRNTFKRNLANGTLPRCLVFAVLSISARFTDEPFYGGRGLEASDAYSRQSWLCVIADHLSVDNNLELPVIQTVALLSIIDYTAARVSSGWLRLGLAIRLSQDVDLMAEPSCFLSPIEREERRRTFWSIYMVDKLISCARSRPAALMDHDCTLQLPCAEDLFQGDGEEETTNPTLQQALSWDSPMDHPPSLFGLALIAASIFGRCTKYAHGRNGGEILPPLDPQSDFASTKAALLILESYLKSKDQPILDLIRQGPQAGSNLDEQQAGQLIFAHALFHLCYCLLNHPFLFRIRSRPIAARVPKSFASNAFRSALENARKLTDLLVAGANGIIPLQSSFYTYCGAIATGLHSLAFGAQHRAVEVESYDARWYYHQSIEALEKLANLWPMVPNMLTKLRAFDSQSESYAHLLDVNCLAENLDISSENVLWSLVDYGMLAKGQPQSSPMTGSFLSNLPSPSRWNINVDDLTPLSPTSQARNLFFC